MTKPTTQPLSEETVESLQKLGGILMRIVERLVREKKVKIENGKIIFNDDHNRRIAGDTSQKI